MEKKTWVLVAHKAGASLLERTGKPENDLRIIRKIENPKGRLQSRELNSGRPGSSRNGRTGRRFSMAADKKPVRNGEELFAHKLAKLVNEGAEKKKYDQLVLVAESRMLGYLRSELKKRTITKVTREIRKDFGRLGEAGLIKRIHAMENA